MAELDFGSKGTTIDSAPLDNQENTTTPSVVQERADAGSTDVNKEDMNDPNKIEVTIADKTSPLIVLFGSPSCGKTMTLVRLTRYLKKNGYAVKPVTSFRPAYDSNYKSMCDNYDKVVNDQYAANSTSKINFMLVAVSKNGKTLCQILEGPGEFYFNPQEPKAPFPAYVNSVINTRNRKIWTVMVEPDNTNAAMGPTERRNYVDKIANLKKRVAKTDKFIFIMNKVDATDFIITQGEVNMKEAKKYVEDLYPNIFSPFENVNPVTKFVKPYNCDFIAFHTGDFAVTSEGSRTFQEGADAYPQKLWELISRRIHG